MQQQRPDDTGSGNSTHRFVGRNAQVSDSSWWPEQFDDAGAGHPAAAGGQHHWWFGRKLLRERDFQLTEREFSLLGEESRDRPAYAAFNLHVEVEKGAPQPFGDHPSDGGLPGAWEPHQHEMSVDLGTDWGHELGRRWRGLERR